MAGSLSLLDFLPRKKENRKSEETGKQGGLGLIASLGPQGLLDFGPVLDQSGNCQSLSFL